MIKHASLFSQLLCLIDRGVFNKFTKERESELYSKGFSSWDHFVSMLFCQLAQAKSLREICGGLACCLGKIRHLGFNSAPNRSTLSYANAHRPWELYRDVFYHLLDKCRAVSPKKKFHFKNKLLSLDATVIKLCLNLFPWAKFRSTKGAVKLHLLLDHDGYLPVFADITAGKTHEINIAHRMKYPKDSIIVTDRGYNDYRLFAKLCREGVWFVTRMKTNAKFDVIEARPIPAGTNVVSDETIGFTGNYAGLDCPFRLRRVVVFNEKKNEEVVLLTNHFEFDAETIGAIYKDRWQIELFFKAIKQNLKIKTFVGTTENALKIQIWTALIAMLMVKYLQFISKRGWSLSNLIALLRWNLFTYRDLWKWIDDPFETPPEQAQPEQLLLNLGILGQHQK